MMGIIYYGTLERRGCQSFIFWIPSRLIKDTLHSICVRNRNINRLIRNYIYVINRCCANIELGHDLRSQLYSGAIENAVKVHLEDIILS